MTDVRRWRVATADSRIIVPLDSLIALFHRPSGQTHLLASPLPEILAALDDGPANLAELAARLARQFDLAAEDDADAALLARLNELATMGLVTAA
jgi:PqqD family protein of HPr-rel-A system